MKMQPDIIHISKWAKDHKITLNASKQKTLTLSHTNRGLYPLYMDGQFIEEVLSHRHLGIMLQTNG